jgi:hypothetical protein
LAGIPSIPHQWAGVDLPHHSIGLRAPQVIRYCRQRQPFIFLHHAGLYRQAAKHTASLPSFFLLSSAIERASPNLLIGYRFAPQRPSCDSAFSLEQDST